MSDSTHDTKPAAKPGAAKKSSNSAPKPKQAKPTAGPSEDDRFGAGTTAAELAARITEVNDAGKGSRITIGHGRAHGVRPDLEGYVRHTTGMLARFSIERVDENRSYAVIEMSRGVLGDHRDVVINPLSWPGDDIEPATDLRARVIGIAVEAEGTRITIGMGTNQGVRSGLPGSLVSADGREIADFEIAGSEGRRSWAFVQTTFDIVSQNQNVILNPAGRQQPRKQRRK